MHTLALSNLRSIIRAAIINNKIFDTIYALNTAWQLRDRVRQCFRLVQTRYLNDKFGHLLA